MTKQRKDDKTRASIDKDPTAQPNSVDHGSSSNINNDTDASTTNTSTTTTTNNNNNNQQQQQQQQQQHSKLPPSSPSSSSQQQTTTTAARTNYYNNNRKDRKAKRKEKKEQGLMNTYLPPPTKPSSSLSDNSKHSSTKSSTTFSNASDRSSLYAIRPGALHIGPMGHDSGDYDDDDYDHDVYENNNNNTNNTIDMENGRIIATTATTTTTTNNNNNNSVNVVDVTPILTATRVSSSSTTDIAIAEHDTCWIFFKRNRKAQIICFSMTIIGIILIAAIVIVLVENNKKKNNNNNNNNELEEEFYIPIGKPIDGDIRSTHGSSISINQNGTRLAIADNRVVKVYDYYDYNNNNNNNVMEDENNNNNNNNDWYQIGSTIDGSIIINDDEEQQQNFINNNQNQIQHQQLPMGVIRTPIIIDLSRDGNSIAIGWPFYSTQEYNQIGRVTVYRYNTNTNTNSNNGIWEPIGNTLMGNISNDLFGTDVSLSSDGTILAVGNAGNGGNVHVYSLVVVAKVNNNNNNTTEEQDSSSSTSLWVEKEGTNFIQSSLLDNIIEENNENENENENENNENETNDTQFVFSVGSVALSADGSILALSGLVEKNSTNIKDNDNNNNNNDDNGKLMSVVSSIFQWVKEGDDNDNDDNDNDNDNDESSTTTTTTTTTTTGWYQLGFGIQGYIQDVGYNVELSADGTIVALSSYYVDGLVANNNKVSNNNININNALLDSRIFQWTTTTTTSNNNNDTTATNTNNNNNNNIVALVVDNNNESTSTSTSRRRKRKRIMDGEWMLLGNRIHSNESGPKVGYYISLSDNGRIMGMGDPGQLNMDGGITGHTHLYTYTSTSTSTSSKEQEQQEEQEMNWIQIGPNEPGESPGDHFGYDISISGDGTTLAVSSPFNRGTGFERGRVYVYNITFSL